MSSPRSNDLPQTDDHDTKSSGGESKRRKLTAKKRTEASKPREPTEAIGNVQGNTSNLHQPHNGRPSAAQRCRKMLFAQLQMTSAVTSPGMSQNPNSSPIDGELRRHSKQRQPAEIANASITKDHSGRRVYEVPVNVASIGASAVIHAVHSIVVRHDFIFDSDPNLQIQAHHASRTAQQKQAKADEFWEALATELGNFMQSPRDFQASAGLTWTLPALLTSVHEMLLTLVRPEMGRIVSDMLDIQLIMQQLTMGVANLDKLATWLADFLKTHCAPMRDRQVDQMLKDILEGNHSGDITTLVAGLHGLLKVVEAMILDTVNHQVRCLKAFLIQDAVNHERKYFMKHIADGQMDMKTSRAWYDALEASYIGPDPDYPISIFFFGLGNCLQFSKRPDLPITFTYDAVRIMKLRADVLEAINLEVCLDVLEQNVFRNDRTNDEKAAWASHTMSLRSLIIDIVGQFECNLRPTTRAEYYAQHETAALRRWHMALPSVAAEIMRAGSLPLSSCAKIEEQLRHTLSNPRHEMFFRHEYCVMRRLTSFFDHLLADLADLSNYDLHLEAAKSDSTLDLDPEMPMDVLLKDIARKATHLGLHHWRIWANIAYTDITDDIFDNESSDDDEFGSVSNEDLIAAVRCGGDIGSIVRSLSSQAVATGQLQMPQLLPSPLADDAISDIGDVGLVPTTGSDEPAVDLADKTPKSELPKKKAAKRQNSVCGEETEKTADDTFKQEK